MTEPVLSDYQETSDEDLITFTRDNKGLPQSVIYILGASKGLISNAGENYGRNWLEGKKMSTEKCGLVTENLLESQKARTPPSKKETILAKSPILIAKAAIKHNTKIKGEIDSNQ